MPTSQDNTIDHPYLPDFPNYRASRQGRIYHFRSGRWIRMSEYTDEGGYKQVKLRRDGKRYTRHVHALILRVFVGPCPPGLICRHLDGNPANNRVRNLKWGTHQENADDAKRHGTTTKGSKAKHAKLTEEEVGEILWYAQNANYTPKMIAACWPISVAQATQICERKAWKHVEPYAYRGDRRSKRRV